MEKVQLHIKNVVCQRCITTVEQILQNMDIPYSKVMLGEAYLERELSSIERHQLKQQFEKVGFEVIENRNEKLINSIKSIIIEEVYNNENTHKLSTILAKQLNYDYSHITHAFTESEGQSIQKFYNAIRIERAKELLNYDEYTITIIADKLGYSTPAYFSTSFKKTTNFSPSEYKTLQRKDRKNLDSV